MENLTYILNLEYLNIGALILKTLFFSICTYLIFLKIINKDIFDKENKRIVILKLLITSILCGTINDITNKFISTICLSSLLAYIFAKSTNNKIGYSIIITVISLSINYIIYFITLIISYAINIILNIQNDYISLLLIVFIHILFIYMFLRIKRFKNGFEFLNNNIKNEYFDVLILNISSIIIFCSIIFSSTDINITTNIFFGFIIFSIIMFITIQKSLQLYYKQKMLIQDLNETKAELEQKNEEIKQLEQDNLNFSKKSHSIAHKQKALEHKLNKIMKNAEIVEENDIKNRINEISQEIINTDTTIKLTKTNIQNIDDMLEYMKSECVKNKIEFELQLNGNVYYMVNNFVSKEDLEILLADHIKNAIIAINYSDNVNKSILIRLGIIDGIYSLYIYDSGIEFEIDTLKNLGKKPSTTHADSGGTGMGFMNTFDTLNKYKASMIIEEYGKPSRDNYTKAIMIKFDKNNEFKICSYRDEQVNYAKL